VTRVEVVEPDPGWPAEFDAIARALRSALDGLALRIDHIGSTSVPGLAAKDVIDVQLTVVSLEPAHVLDGLLAALGYEPVAHVDRDHVPPGLEPGDPAAWRKRLFRAPPGQRRTNLHVRVDGRPNQRYPLLFRDYLRAFPAAAAGYAQLKRELARWHADDSEAYTVIKDPVCDIVMAAAEDWAARVDWRPGPADA
jgi:GrpB-like predicted nucleotidyltransferase (UPF0157 family)